MAQFSMHNLPRVTGGLVGTGLATVIGAGLIVVGSGAVSMDGEVAGSTRLVSVGLTALVGAAVLGLWSASILFQRDWGQVNVPSLSPQDYLAALADTPPPAWTCTRCRVLHPDTGLGTCVYCDSGAYYYSLDTDEDLKMVIASLG